MDSFVLWFAVIADVITVVAGIIAILGVVWAIRSAAKLETRVEPLTSHSSSLTLNFVSVGSSPVKSLDLRAGNLTSDDFSTAGGVIAKIAEFNRGEALSITAFDAADTHFQGDPADNEYRWEISSNQGFYVQAQWRSPLLPWRRRSRTYVWTVDRREAGDEPKRFTGRAELEFLKKARTPS